MKVASLSFLFVVISVFNAVAQKEASNVSISLLENDRVADINVSKEKFIQSISIVTDYCKTNFKNTAASQKIGILLIAHKSGKPTIKCYSNPTLDDSTQNKILADISAMPIENTNYVDFPMLITVNASNENPKDDFPDFIDPVKLKMTDYENADFKTKYALIKKFALEEALPILTAYEANVDSTVRGVKSFGTLLQATDFSKVQNITALTDKNKNYWKATMEMASGNQLIPITKIFMLISQGEFDYAKKYIDVYRMFSNKTSISALYLEALNYRLNLFYKGLTSEMDKGITAHDKGRYDDAIKIYKNILTDYPNSAWALYEKYYSENAKNGEEHKISPEDRKDWDKAKINIYKHDPLYNMDVRASTGKEAFLLTRRMEMKELFKVKENRLTDLLNYASIATDLGVYDFAAQLYWLSITMDKENTEKAINNFLFCLDKLGEKDLKSNFKGDFNQIFKNIEKENEARMKNSASYKAMKN
jgi:tetratricopeptide (TPR) repeat protein